MDAVEKYRNNGKVFTVGTTPHIYYLTNTLPPGNVFSFQFPWFMKKVDSIIYTELVKDPPNVVIIDRSSMVSGIKLIEYMPNILDYLENNFKTLEFIDKTEVMVKDR